MQCFPGCLWGAGDAGAQSQTVPVAWRGRDLVVGGVCCCPSDLTMVVPLHCPPDIPVFEDVYFRAGQRRVHSVPADELDGADHGVTFRGRSLVEDLVDVLGGRAPAGGVLRRLG